MADITDTTPALEDSDDDEFDDLDEIFGAEDDDAEELWEASYL